MANQPGASNQANIEADIIGYLDAHYGVDRAEIHAAKTLEDLGLDSLGVLAIADLVEKKYSVSLDDERIAGVRTFTDLMNLIARKRAEAA